MKLAVAAYPALPLASSLVASASFKLRSPFPSPKEVVTYPAYSGGEQIYRFHLPTMGPASSLMLLSYLGCNMGVCQVFMITYLSLKSSKEFLDQMINCQFLQRAENRLVYSGARGTYVRQTSVAGSGRS